MMIKLKPKSVAFAALLAFLVLLAALNIHYMVSLIFWRFGVDITDGAVYSIGLANLYKSFGSYPFLITYYPPLYYLVVFGAKSALRFVDLPFFSTRLISFIAILLDSALIYFVTKRAFGLRDRYNIAASLLFLSSSLVMVTSNPVMFELLFDLLAIFFLLARNRKGLVLAGISLSAAFLFKQSAIAILAAAVIYLLLERKFRDALILLAVFAAVVCPIVLVLNVMTQGRFVFSLFVIPLITPFSASQLGPLLFDFVFEAPLLIFLIPIAYLIKEDWRSLISVLLIAVVIFSIASAAKYGSSTYYFVVAMALSCIASMPAMSHIFEDKSHRAKIFRNAVFASLVLILLIYGEVYNAVLIVNSGLTPSLQGIESYLNSTRGTILSENPNLAIVAGKQVVFEPSIYWVLDSKGLWNDSAIVGSICEHNFSVIVFPEKINTFSNYPGLMGAINQYYHLNNTLDGWYIYRPDTERGKCTKT